MWSSMAPPGMAGTWARMFPGLLLLSRFWRAGRFALGIRCGEALALCRRHGRLHAATAGAGQRIAYGAAASVSGGRSGLGQNRNRALMPVSGRQGSGPGKVIRADRIAGR
ncbi:hypothetical protein [Roseomonas marmotae]|uniref:Uncharacterized protein n=1 Tax=Roseomonas marmotae TaxID=2768161 RepID=A0ABS3K9Z9_9PROT|nr:hypothetical protein [Roseomonas marmotae]MBO1074293.1 hypothetical protein [Roseomonas marmotae]QTI78047.1 hypothetical protein IAI58_09935 [Roseomonas marmotae]